MEKIVIGTRKSKLALWQTGFVKERLESAHTGLTIEIQHIVTRGDRTQAEGKPLPEIGGKGLFTAELEEALENGSIDIAVHSLKDLPTDMSAKFALGAICERESAWDALITRSGQRLLQLEQGAVIGSSSVRRASQILRLRPDMKIQPIRGNVDTRLSKLFDGGSQYSAIVLAHAGLCRLGLESRVTQLFAAEEMLPAPGQGALAVQCRSGDRRILDLLRPLDHARTRAEVAAERAFLGRLEAGCNTPVAARATASDGALLFTARCLSPDGQQCIELSGQGTMEAAERLGQRMAEEAIAKGFESMCRGEG